MEETPLDRNISGKSLTTACWVEACMQQNRKEKDNILQPALMIKRVKSSISKFHAEQLHFS